MAGPVSHITRFAPSPNGYLHLGHVYAAMVAEDAALATGGTFRLRLEDLDAARCRPEFAAAIEDDLAWLGFSWPRPVVRQSERFDAYRAALRSLEDLGVLYPCFCTRRDIAAEIAQSAAAPHGPEGPLYPGTCRRLDGATRARLIGDGRAHALRLDHARAAAMAGDLDWFDLDAGRQRAAPARLGDVVLARKEMSASYHLAVVVDDAAEGITLITRGRDLFEATHVHRLLQALLELPAPFYRHHPLVVDETGARLAKRDGGVTVRALRDAGRLPADVRAMAASQVERA